MNTSSNALQVVCAWPVSGQYGPGSRVLYYVLVAACVLARKVEWLRNACLAAALLFPAVAAIHGIVLAALHVNGAVDMDVYGAFQLCSIGILAAPLTVRLSRTYFYDPGRNTIFLWTGLILAGLLSLTVEFYRITTSSCTHDDDGNPISSNAAAFPYGSATCNLTCSPEKGPHSPMREAAANNIYVIPAPQKLTFDTAMLLAAACCIPAILSLVFMWDKILKINWRTRFGDEEDEERVDEPIEGTNGATIGKMRGVNNIIRLFLGVVEIPVFGAAVLAILSIGESNFFSDQVSYQTEPIASVGQWAPIAGTVLAALGSLYLLFTSKVEVEVANGDIPVSSMHHCNCSQHHHSSEGRPSLHGQPGMDYSPNSRSFDGNELGMHATLSNELAATTSRPGPEQGHQNVGSRRKIASALTKASNYLGTAAHNKLDVSSVKGGSALGFPEIPAEEQRNRALPQIRAQYIQRRDAVLREQRLSRVGSSAASVASGLGIEGISTTPRATSPLGSPRARRDTLEIPQPVHH